MENNYNGWSNWETWEAWNLLSNNEETYKHAIQHANRRKWHYKMHLRNLLIESMDNLNLPIAHLFMDSINFDELLKNFKDTTK